MPVGIRGTVIAGPLRHAADFVCLEGASDAGPAAQPRIAAALLLCVHGKLLEACEAPHWPRVCTTATFERAPINLGIHLDGRRTAQNWRHQRHRMNLFVYEDGYTGGAGQ